MAFLENFKSDEAVVVLQRRNIIVSQRQFCLGIYLMKKKKNEKKWGWCSKDIMRHIQPIPHSGNIISILSTIFSCYIALYLIKIQCTKEKSGLEIEYETKVYRVLNILLNFHTNAPQDYIEFLVYKHFLGGK